LSFVNDVCQDIEKAPDRRDAFEYGEDDRFPIAADDALSRTETSSWTDEALGLVVEESLERCARAVAGEIARLVESQATIRDITTGIRRPVRPGDVAILFRTRDSHRAFEDALERRAIASYVYKGLGFFDSDEVRDVLALLGFLANPGSDLRAAAFFRSGFVRLSDEALRRLAPHLAAAVTGPEPPEISRLDPLDASTLTLARKTCGRWLQRVDRLSHSELLDLALSESAYAVELRGARARQARENLKKVRGLVRRAQNKGYTTLGRIVAHLDRLAVGDESNAAIDAVDAVNLMTVHAAKGLEFPVVFVVDLSRGTGSWRPPIRVTMAGDDDVSVSVGDFQSSSDEDDPAQEREETKRLLYVALTRARDRLYLGSVLEDGRLQPARGSLGEVMPATLLPQCVPASEGGVREWRASSGHTHVFNLVRCPSDEELPVSTSLPSVETQAADFARLPSVVQPGGTPVSTPAATYRSNVSSAFAEATAGPRSERLLGTLVHRLIQRAGLTRDIDAGSVQARLRELVRPDEQPPDASLEDVLTRAAAFYATLTIRTDVRRLYETGDVFHEVPFTFMQDGSRSRGSIDCVIARRESADHLDSLTILEFKTGHERSEHSDQVTLYKQAIGQIFPGVPVNAVIVYPERLVVV
jgi:ATP-dependent exoDNAse (exonuclease V) beta subunit